LNLVVNLIASRVSAMPIPPSLLARAGRVIEQDGDY
jgi:hypothetical protein